MYLYHNILLQFSIFLERENLEYIKPINEGIENEYEKNVKKFIRILFQNSNFEDENNIKSNMRNYYEFIVDNLEDGKGVETYSMLGSKYLIILLGFKNGILSGKVIVYKENEDFESKFEIKKEINYLNNLKNGLEFKYDYYRNGKVIIYKRFYTNGLQQGFQITYEKIGDKLEVIKESYYINDNLISSREYTGNKNKNNYKETYFEGNEKIERTFLNGEISSENRYISKDITGYILKSTLFYNNNSQFISFKNIGDSKTLTTYYDNGNIETIANYLNGLLDGNYREFNRNGDDILTQNYKKGVLIN